MYEVIQIIIAYVVADAISGIYHCITDRGYNTPTQVAYFMNHHDHPETMTFDLQPLLGGIPFLIIGYFILPWFLLPLGFFICITQIPHYYTHHPAPKYIRFLQKCKLILTYQSHWTHHGGEFNSNYCVLSGWNDWWINILVKWYDKKK